MSTARLVVALAAALLVACPKDKPAEVDAGAAPPAPGSAAASAAVEDAGTARPDAPATYEGKYTASPSPLYIPSENKDYASVKQAKDDGTTMVGEGTISLTVDGSGRVSGTIDSGPAAPAIVEGVASDGTFSGTVRRKEAGDDGLTGAILGKIAGDSVEGTMTLSNANASVLRQAKLTAKKK